MPYAHKSTQDWPRTELQAYHYQSSQTYVYEVLIGLLGYNQMNINRCQQQKSHHTIFSVCVAIFK